MSLRARRRSNPVIIATTTGLLRRLLFTTFIRAPRNDICRFVRGFVDLWGLFMLNKINRLTKDKDFDNVFKNGKSSYDKLIGVKAIQNQLENSRFGILISTKVSKKAVERNKIKRQIREIIRLQPDKIKFGYDIVIITLPAVLGKSYQEIKGSINCHFKRLGLYNKKQSDN